VRTREPAELRMFTPINSRLVEAQCHAVGELPVAGDGCGNYYVLREDGTVGFVDTMQDPGKIDRQAAGNLLSFMIGLLAHDQETGRASS
jgi:hypothetical protein